MYMDSFWEKANANQPMVLKSAFNKEILRKWGRGTGKPSGIKAASYDCSKGNLCHLHFQQNTEVENGATIQYYTETPKYLTM